MNTLAHNLSTYKRVQFYLPAERNLFQLRMCVCTEREKESVKQINDLMMIVYYLYYCNV